MFSSFYFFRIGMLSLYIFLFLCSTNSNDFIQTLSILISNCIKCIPHRSGFIFISSRHPKLLFRLAIIASSVLFGDYSRNLWILLENNYGRNSCTLELSIKSSHILYTSIYLYYWNVVYKKQSYVSVIQILIK